MDREERRATESPERRRRELTEPNEGVGGGIVPPGGRAFYDTPEAAGSHDDPTPPTPAREPRPWMLLGVVLLVIFLAILAWAVVAGLH